MERYYRVSDTGDRGDAVFLDEPAGGEISIMIEESRKTASAIVRVDDLLEALRAAGALPPEPTQ